MTAERVVRPEYEIQLFEDGEQMCALLGDDRQMGTAGFGEDAYAALESLAQQLRLADVLSSKHPRFVEGSVPPLQMVILEVDQRRIPISLAELREGPNAGEIEAETKALCRLLQYKNRLYGNSALDPLRIFSRAAVAEQIGVRLDDKLSRLMRGNGVETEDIEADILGYLVLARIARRLAAREAK